MNWSDERYVRLYTRDTTGWLMLSWQGQALFLLLMRKWDRAGVLELGGHGLAGIAAHVQKLPAEHIEVGIRDLLRDGCIELHGDRLLLRNFIEAQEASQSDKTRARAMRERRRALTKAGVTAGVTKRDNDIETGVTKRDESSETGVTKRDAVTKRDVNIADRDTTDARVTNCDAFTERNDGTTNCDATVTSCNKNVTACHDVSQRVTPDQPDQPDQRERVPQLLLSVSPTEAPDPGPGPEARLWALQDTLRAEAIPNSRPLKPTPDSLRQIAKLLKAGYTEADCENVLRACAAEAKQKPESRRWFDGTTNWIEKNFRRTLSWTTDAAAAQSQSNGQTPPESNRARAYREARERGEA